MRLIWCFCFGLFSVLSLWLCADVGLRERLNKILASDYFTATPEMKAPVDVAAAAGKYAPSQAPVQDLTVPLPDVEEEGDYAGQYQDKVI